MGKTNRGQSTVEYILLVTAVIVVAILFLGKDGLFQTRLNNTMDTLSEQMTNVANQIME